MSAGTHGLIAGLCVGGKTANVGKRPTTVSSREARPPSTSARSANGQCSTASEPGFASAGYVPRYTVKWRMAQRLSWEASANAEGNGLFLGIDITVHQQGIDRGRTLNNDGF